MKNHLSSCDGSGETYTAHRRLFVAPGRRLCRVVALTFLFSSMAQARADTPPAQEMPVAQWQHFESRLAALEKKLAAAEPAASGAVPVPAPEPAPVAGTMSLSPANTADAPAPRIPDTPAAAGTLPVTPDTGSPPVVPEKKNVEALVTPPDVTTDRKKNPVTAVAPTPLTEQEQDSYVVGMMVADYARSVLQTLEKLDIQLDETLLSEGVRHTLTGTARLDEQTARAAMQRFQKNTDQRQAEKDRASRQMLSTLAGKQDTLEKKEDRVWVRLKKGGPAVSKQTPLSLSWEGRFYNGEVFETVTDSVVNRRDVLPQWQQRAIRLAGPGGQVRLYILAGSLEGEADLPAGTARHELVQYTVSVEKE